MFCFIGGNRKRIIRFLGIISIFILLGLFLNFFFLNDQYITNSASFSIHSKTSFSVYPEEETKTTNETYSTPIIEEEQETQQESSEQFGIQPIENLSVQKGEDAGFSIQPIKTNESESLSMGLMGSFAPTVQNVNVTPIIAYNFTNIFGYGNYSDADSEEEINSTYKWYKNGVLLTSGNLSQLLLCHFDDSYTCESYETGNSSGTSFYYGKYSDGVLFNSTDTLTYSRTNNFNLDKGTIEFWIQPWWAWNETKTNTFIDLTTGTSPTGKYFFIDKSYNSTDHFIRFWLENNTDSDFQDATFILNDTNFVGEKWHHIAGTWDIDNGINLYFNGKKVASDTSYLGNLATYNSLIYIGSSSANYSIHNHTGIGEETANATIDELRISKRVFTGEEINESYHKGRAFYKQEIMLNYSNYAENDNLTFEYTPCDSSGSCGSSVNSSVLTIIPLCEDKDNDGYYAYNFFYCISGNDYDDSNSSIYPTATEICGNFVDDDCDLDYDEGCDYDNDTILNENDNCPEISNLDQNDTNVDGIGDSCNSTYKIIDRTWLNFTQFQNKATNSSELGDMFDYANELGYTEFLNASEIIYGGGINVTTGAFLSDDNNIIYVINAHKNYIEQENSSFSYCSMQNGSSCNNSELSTNESIDISFLVRYQANNNTIVTFNRESGGINNLTDGSVISTWGEGNSCNKWTCIIECIAVTLPGYAEDPFQSLFGLTCSAICKAAYATPYSGLVGLCAGCMGYIGTGCGLDCDNYPCKYGHLCSPGEIKSGTKDCDGNTAIWEQCDSDGEAWEDTSVECIGSSCANGECTSQCTPTWDCYNTESKVYRYADCTWGSLTYCEYGCSGGACLSSGSCPLYAPSSCNGECYGCPEDTSLCCPDSGTPQHCCPSGTSCRESDGQCRIQCTEGWDCYDSTHKAYRYSDCDWSSTTYCEYGCSDGACLTTQCNPGWKCKDSTHKAYQDSECDWSQETLCSYGCSDGECRTQIGAKAKCTIQVVDGVECDEDECDNAWRPATNTDTAEIDGTNPMEWALAKFDLDDCYNGMVKEDIISARLDFWIEDDGEDVSDTDLRVYKGCDDDDVNYPGISSSEDSCMSDLRPNTYNPYYTYVHIVESVDNEGISCGGGYGLRCGIEGMETHITTHIDWSDTDEIVFTWFPESDQRNGWYLDHYPHDPKLILEYAIDCNVNSDCGTTGYIDDPTCSGGDVWWKYITYTCSSQTCYNSTRLRRYQNCGDTSYGAYKYYCNNNNTDLYKNRTIYYKGCSNGDCTSSFDDEGATFERTCTYGCENNTCLGSTIVNLTNPTDNQYTSINNITFNVSVSDETGLSNCTLYTDITGSWIKNDTYTLTGISNSTTWSWYDITKGNYIWNALCYDTNGNSNWSATNYTFTIWEEGINKFYVKNSTDTAAYFDDNGNLILKGSCTSGGTCEAGDNTFIIKDNGGNEVAHIDQYGNLCIETGDCSDESSSCGPTNDAHIIQNSTGSIVSYMDVTGDLCLTGILGEYGTP